MTVQIRMITCFFRRHWYSVDSVTVSLFMNSDIVRRAGLSSPAMQAKHTWYLGTPCHRLMQLPLTSYQLGNLSLDHLFASSRPHLLFQLGHTLTLSQHHGHTLNSERIQAGPSSHGEISGPWALVSSIRLICGWDSF